MAFTLRVPFRAAPTFELSGLEHPQRLRVGTLDLELRRSEATYVLEVRGLATAEEAALQFEGLRTAFAWIAIDASFPVIYEERLAAVTYAADPKQAAANLSASFGVTFDERVDGLADGNRPVAYPSDKSVRYMSGGDVSLLVTQPGEAFLKRIEQALSLPNAVSAYSDAKLAVALDLYRSHFLDSSDSGRFLTLAMCLEALCVSELKPEPVLALLSTWRTEIDVRIQLEPPNSEGRAGFEALRRELLFRRETSIRSQVRTLVRTALATHPEVEAIARETLALYDKRSTLVHEGALPREELRPAQSRLRVIVGSILRARLGAKVGAV